MSELRDIDGEISLDSPGILIRKREAEGDLASHGDIGMKTGQRGI